MKEGRWSDNLIDKLPVFMSGCKWLVNILSINVFVPRLIFVEIVISGKRKLDIIVKEAKCFIVFRDVQ